MTNAIDVALLLLRAVIATLLFAHATQKLLGWFSGSGLRGSGALFEKLGQRPGVVMAAIAGAAELLTATLVGIGLATQAGAVIGAATMLVAGGSLSKRSKSFWNTSGGGEYPFTLAAVLVVIGFAGPGKVSLDALWCLPWYASAQWGVTIGLVAVGLAVLAALPPLLRSRPDVE